MDFSFVTEFLSHLHTVFPQRAGVLIISLMLISLLGVMYGGSRSRAIPAFWVVIDSLFNNFCEKAFKQDKNRSDLMFRGAGLTLLALILSVVVGYIVIVLNALMGLSGLVGVLCVSTCLSTGAHWKMMGGILRTLKGDGKNSESTYYSVASSSRVDLNTVDDSGVTRVASNFSILSFEAMIVLPSLGFLLGGFIGCLCLSALSYVCWRVGRQGEGKGADSFARNILKPIKLISVPITLLMLLLACLFVPFANIVKGIKGVLAHRLSVLGLVSYALNIVLSGPVKDIDGWVVKLGWIGPESASAQMDLDLIKRVRYLHFISTVLWAATIILLLFAYKTFFL